MIRLRFIPATPQFIMMPSSDRYGLANTRVRFALGKCALGSVLVAMSARGVLEIAFGDDPDVLARAFQERYPQVELINGDSEFEETVAKVIRFIEMPASGLDLPLDLRGTAFQQRVWRALQQIPAGAKVSYTEIAERIGAPKSVRAVAAAIAANRLAVAIPCHRVIRADGRLSGYRWGVERKAELLHRESKAGAFAM
jgi:AraC family transcriptional regulator of adaptative response/methylated-DNA-[protein]-cysteine methyltransferase